MFWPLLAILRLSSRELKVLLYIYIYSIYYMFRPLLAIFRLSSREFKVLLYIQYILYIEYIYIVYTTCFGPYWPSSGCLQENLRSYYIYSTYYIYIYSVYCMFRPLLAIFRLSSRELRVLLYIYIVHNIYIVYIYYMFRPLLAIFRLSSRELKVLLYTYSRTLSSLEENLKMASSGRNM